MLIELDPLEIHSGIIDSRYDHSVASDPQPTRPPGEVLEALLVEALEHPPCHVLFSGGRDSAVILAAATRAARRHGLADPIPMTAVVNDIPEAREDEWQERAMAGLGLADWVKLDVTDEFDLLGPAATAALRTHGLFWPSFGATMRFYAERAGGGTIVTGGGGDELLTSWYWRRITPRELAAVRPLSRAVRWGTYFALPLLPRQRIASTLRPQRIELPWLLPGAEDELNRRLSAGTPGRSWAADLERHLASRYRWCVRTLLDTLAAEQGVRLVEPFYDPRLVRSVGAAAPRAGFFDRTTAFRALFAGLVPDDVLARTSKAVFTRAFWGPRARAFARDWDGTGVDAAIVDPARLRQAWQADVPDGRAATALHHAWLNT